MPMSAPKKSSPQSRNIVNRTAGAFMGALGMSSSRATAAAPPPPPGYMAAPPQAFDSVPVAYNGSLAMDVDMSVAVPAPAQRQVASMPQAPVAKREAAQPPKPAAASSSGPTVADIVTTLTNLQDVDGSWSQLPADVQDYLRRTLGASAPAPVADLVRAQTLLVVAWLERQLADPATSPYVRQQIEPMVALAHRFL